MPYFFDGNNIIGLSAEAARSDRQTRRAFLELLSRHASSRGGRFIVFFDGDDPDRSMPPRGVRVRFSAPLTSDAAIIREIEGSPLPSEINVVTNDRSLAAQGKAAGARVMNWSEFTRKLARRTRPAPGSSQKEEQVNLKDWSDFFGLDPDSLE